MATARAIRAALRNLRKIRTRYAYGKHNRYAPELRKYDLQIKTNPQGDRRLAYTWETSYQYLFQRKSFINQVITYVQYLKSKKLLRRN